MADDPNMALEDLRRRIRGGARPLLDGLSNEELVAARRGRDHQRSLQALPGPRADALAPLPPPRE
jgi:hypothetical protein